MSLVSTWVEAQDGLFYQNPVLEGDGWFVCFDDDEPPEVVKTAGLSKTFAEVLQDAKIPWGAIQTKYIERSSRIFDGKFRNAKSCFFELTGPIPVPQKFDDCHNDPQGQGVYYRFTKVTKRKAGWV